MGVASLRSISVNSRMEADFNFMYLMKPAKMKIRRNFNTGVWAQFKCSSHSLQFHLKVSRVSRLSDIHSATAWLVFVLFHTRCVEIEMRCLS